jgi:hypothetical protein
MEPSKSHDNWTAYDYFLERLDKAMREAMVAGSTHPKADRPKGQKNGDESDRNAWERGSHGH